MLAISACADGLRSWLFQSAAERVMFRLRTRLFAALLSQEVGCCCSAGLPLRLLACQLVCFAATCAPCKVLRCAEGGRPLLDNAGPFCRPACRQVGFYDRVRTGELTNRLSEDTRMIKTVATSSIASALRSAAICSLGLAMMCACCACCVCCARASSNAMCSGAGWLDVILLRMLC